MIDFDEPRFQLVVNHDVHAQNLEAHRVFQIVWLASAIRMRKSRLHCYHSLCAYVLNLLKHIFLVEIRFVLLHELQHSCERALRTSIVINIVVLDEIA